MAQPLTTSVNPDDLDNLGIQFGNAAEEVHNALPDPSTLTSIPPEAFGPATGVYAAYLAIAAQFTVHLNDAVTSLQSGSQYLHNTASRYRQIEAANAARIGGH
ncbi:MAG TPA: hypothetical protein VGM75_14550 [Pseudonocardiaceae bacterium]|jgi:hypothetical protein